MRCTLSAIRPILSARHRTDAGVDTGQTKRFARSRSSAKSTSTAYRSEMSSGSSSSAVLGDRELEAALEVVLVVDARQLADERLLVAARDVVDADGLADAALDGLGELVDEALGS